MSAKKDNVIVVHDEWKKPPINIDEDNAEFYDGLKKHKLLVWQCKECGKSYWPKAFCHGDHALAPYADNMHWVEAKGTGKLYAFNRHHWAFHPGFKNEIPYIYALIELDEGPLISAQLYGDKLPKDVYDVGQKVEIVYEDHPAEGFTLPRFRIVG